ncbi:MAG: TadE/TadG family type IV pilus assembly protein [Magnetovibrionaceae bacterium]
MIRLFPLFRRFSAREDGNIAVEMAIALPILISLLLGGLEIMTFTLLNEKTERASASLADLVAQSESLSAGELADLTGVASEIMEPFDVSTSGRIIVSSISADPEGTVLINWQKAYGGGGGGSRYGAAGGTPLLPVGLIVRPNESLIAAEVFFDHEPIFTPKVISATRVERASVLRPRFAPLTQLAD